jgi:hypothetical protein
MQRLDHNVLGHVRCDFTFAMPCFGIGVEGCHLLPRSGCGQIGNRPCVLRSRHRS